MELPKDVKMSLAGLIWKQLYSNLKLCKKIYSFLNLANIYASFLLNFPASFILRLEKQALGKLFKLLAK